MNNDLNLKTGDILLFSNNNKNKWDIFKWLYQNKDNDNWLILIS